MVGRVSGEGDLRRPSREFHQHAAVLRQLANGAKTTSQTGSVIEEAATSRSAKRLMVQKPT
jgi:hypothetical protein